MDFKSSKKTEPIRIDSNPKDTKNLPSYRGSSEIPEHSESSNITDADLATAFSIDDELPEDPTDLTLERERKPEDLANIDADNMNKSSTNPGKKKASKKQIIILLAILLVVILGALATIFVPKYLNKEDDLVVQTTDTPVTKKEVAPATAPSPLSGVEVSPELAKRSVTAVMIENSPDARPQSSLLEAEMVFEAIAEGGITRFIALFQTTLPSKIGPIRSARPYYVDIAKTFDAAYVHAGGSPDALARISELGVKDMSAFEQDTYYRADDRDAPHNLYSSMSLLDTRKEQLGYTGSAFSPWKRKVDSPQTPIANTINFDISSESFNPQYTYDATTNSYLRSHTGDVHIDQVSAKQINPKVVIALVTSRGQEGIYSNYRLNGSGEIRVFQDGIVSEGTWSKENVTSQFVFKDKNGLEFNFNKGQTWVTLVESTTDINYVP